MKNFRRLFLTAFAVIICCGMCLASCSSVYADNGDYKKVTKDVPVGYFCKVESSGSADIVFVQGKKNSVRIVGTKRLVDNLDVRVKGETLSVTSKGNNRMRFNGNLFSSNVEYNITVYVSSPDLTDITLKGSGDFKMNGNLDTDALKIAVMGSGEVEMQKVVCDNAVLELNGSGDLKAKSLDCHSATLSVRGSGDMDIDRLKAQTSEINLRGSGDIETYLDRVASTSASIVGSGDIDLHFNNCGSAICEVRGSGSMELKGTLRSLNQKSTGTGDIDTHKLVVGR